jgi:hypothetical protein
MEPERRSEPVWPARCGHCPVSRLSGDDVRASAGAEIHCSTALRRPPGRRGRGGADRLRRDRRLRALAAVVVVSFLCLVAVASPASAGVTHDATVESIIDSVTQAELEPVVADLSGAQTCSVGGLPYTFTTRRSNSGEPIDKAEQYVYEKLSGYGLDSVTYETFTSGTGGRNVVGEITGSSPARAGEIVVIGAHLDDTSSGASAPGADDNASGISAMLFLARSLAGHEFECTIRFVAFGDEEGGIWGSDDYASACQTRGDDVVAMVSADMLGYSNGTGDVELYVRPLAQDAGSGDRAIARTYADVLSAYDIALTPVVVAENPAHSDCDSFWAHGYHAVMVIESLSPMNPNYHSPADTVSTLDWSYYAKVTKALAGQTAHLAGIDTTGPSVTGITSSTHAVSADWYSNATASFGWTATDTQTGVDGYSFVVDQNAGTTPDTTSEGSDTSFTSGMLPQGVSYLHVRALDGAGNWGATVSRAVRVDTVAPATRAPYRAAVRRGRVATLKYKVLDPAPNGGTATVTIRVKTLGGRTVRILLLEGRAVNVVRSATFRCRLARGTYRFFVYAADAAGNRQTAVGVNRLVVR